MPVFDSVWLDALVQKGRLTPFQAQILESDHPDQSILGPFRLIEQITKGGEFTTFRALHPASGRFFAVKLSSESHLDNPDNLEAWNRLIASLKSVEKPISIGLSGLEQSSRQPRKLSHWTIVGPQICERTPRGIALASPWIDGPHLQDLLIRRGRFPVEVVFEIGRQILTQLEIASTQHIVHGDIRATNIKLGQGGVVHLVDCGIRPILEPEQTIHNQRPPDRFDGIAPELISTTAPYTHQSDLYALGCLLWQLLVGRPVFPAGDPLVKLTAHREKTIPDVCEFAPDVPAHLGRLIQQLTAHDPAARPYSAADILDTWCQLAPPRVDRIRTFRRSFDSPVRLPGPSTRRTWGYGVLAIFVLTLLGLYFTDHLSTEFRWPLSPVATVGEEDNQPTYDEKKPALTESSISQSTPRTSKSTRATNIGSAPSSDSNASTSDSHPDEIQKASAEILVEHSQTPAVPISDQRTLPDIPRANATGVIELISGAEYRLTAIHAVGPLIIRGDATDPPRVVVDRPIELTAETIRIEGVRIETASTSAGDPTQATAQILIRAQSFTIEQVQFVDIASQATAEPIPLLRWELVDDRDTRPTTAVVKNAQFDGRGVAIVLPQPVSIVQFNNCLVENHAAIVELAGSARRSRTVAIRMQHVTGRALASVIRWWGDDGPPQGVRLQWEPKNCLIDLRKESSACCVFLSAKFTNDWLNRLRVRGDGTQLQPGHAIATWQSDQLAERIDWDSTDVDVEGITIQSFETDADGSLSSDDTNPKRISGPRKSGKPPGADRSLFFPKQATPEPKR